MIELLVCEAVRVWAAAVGAAAEDADSVVAVVLAAADVGSVVADSVVDAADLAADIWVGAGVKAPKHHTTIAANHF
jgi:hypothetical protein